jgi:hypothetical protein
LSLHGSKVKIVKVKVQNNNTKQRSEVKYRAYTFSLEVIKFIKDFPNDKTYSILSNQLLRSATSIGANIVEGGSGSSRKDFTRYKDDLCFYYGFDF